VLEHFDYVDAILLALKEWKRALKPGGCAYISVPDMDALCRLFLSSELTLDQRFFVMRMMFGGHVDRYDYHVVGLNEEFLTNYLGQAGYLNIRRVGDFNIFSDTSQMCFMNVPISVNLIAEKPLTI
jgi:predicted SAM-dependent methyltransferase